VRKFWTFVAVGGVTALVYLGLMALLLNVVGLNYRVCVSVAYVGAIALHFSLNRHVTFRSADGNIFPQAWRYLAMVAINYVVTLAIVSYVVEVLNHSAFIGAISALVATIVVGYIVSRSWVFKVSKGPNG